MTNSTLNQCPSQSSTYKLSKAATAEMNLWIKKFPKDNKRPVIIHALMFVQEENRGWLNTAMMDAVADYLELPRIDIYEVAKFYSMYELQEVGRHKICLCTNISCMLNGSDEITNHITDKLKINFGETTKDKKFSLRKVECLAACGGAPAMQINGKYYENLTPAKIDKILASLK